jgi:hypothetical protein
MKGQIEHIVESFQVLCSGNFERVLPQVLLDDGRHVTLLDAGARHGPPASRTWASQRFSLQDVYGERVAVEANADSYRVATSTSHSRVGQRNDVCIDLRRSMLNRDQLTQPV